MIEARKNHGLVFVKDKIFFGLWKMREMQIKWKTGDPLTEKSYTVIKLNFSTQIKYF